MKNLPFALLFCCIFLLVANGCASLTGFETGRTVGHNAGELTVSLNASRTPDFDLNQDEESDAFFFPNLEASGRFGVSPRVDLGLRANTNFNLGFEAKWQLVGDETSEVALAVGGGVGTFALFSGLWNTQLPVYFSLHPTENFAFYLNPRYTFQFSAGNLAGGINYLGGNVGVLYGRRIKYGLDAGLYNLTSTAPGNEYVNFLTIGFGVKFPL